MKARIACLVLAALPILNGCVTPPPPSGPSVQPTVQARSMQRMMFDVDQIRTFVYGGGACHLNATH